MHLADEIVPLWQATEWRAAAPQPPPFWAFAWPGSIALARYLLDNPSVVHARRVLDFGSGSGLAAIAAAKCGATSVVALDVDPIAAEVQVMNAALNGVTFERMTADATTTELESDVVLAGDVCYEREASAQTLAWLRLRKQRFVLLADPGRHYAPTDGLRLLATYDVPVLKDLESVDTKRTRVWRISPLSEGEGEVTSTP